MEMNSSLVWWSVALVAAVLVAWASWPLQPIKLRQDIDRLEQRVKDLEEAR